MSTATHNALPDPSTRRGRARRGLRRRRFAHTRCSGRGTRWPTRASSRARLGVDVFFIPSGFVLTHADRDACRLGRLDYGWFHREGLTGPVGQSFTARSRSALTMTLTLESAIAAAAMAGESSQPKAG